MKIISSYQIVSGKLPPGKFPLIKLPPGEFPAGKFRSRKLPSMFLNIPTHVLKSFCLLMSTLKIGHYYNLQSFS